jgi:hypothetical protein
MRKSELFGASLTVVTCQMLSVGCSAEGPHEPEAIGSVQEPIVYWHKDAFTYLPAYVPVDKPQIALATLVRDLPHPNDYTPLSEDRRKKLVQLVDAIFVAITNSKADQTSGDWCGVNALADAAGYTVHRFYDAANGRWLVFGQDRTHWGGQAYFVINPMGKRDLVIEVPHAGTETGTAEQGAAMFMSLAAKVLLINKAPRCGSPYHAECQRTRLGSLAKTNECGDAYYRQSDASHNQSSAFQEFHSLYNRKYPTTKFVQLHGMGSSRLVDASDGSREVNAASISAKFETALRDRLPAEQDPLLVNSCQLRTTHNDNPLLCGTFNMQGRETNRSGAAGEDICLDYSASPGANGRFLHLEQADIVRSYAALSSMVTASVAATWSFSCEASGTCALGERQSVPANSACAAPPAPTASRQVNLTYYHVAEQPVSDSPATSTFKHCNGDLVQVGSFGSASPAFWEHARTQGTVFLNAANSSGPARRRINLLDHDSGCFYALPLTYPRPYPWGAGSYDSTFSKEYELHPFRSVAGDSSFVRGAWYYIKQFDGVQISTLDSFQHDGCVRVVDTGPAVNGAHLDFFAGTQAGFESLNSLVPTTWPKNDPAKMVTVSSAAGKCDRHIVR